MSMKFNALMALAALVALPLGASQAMAGPAGADVAKASSIDTRTHIIDVRKGRGGIAFRSRGGPRHAFRGGGRPGKHWHGGHGHRHHGHRHFRPRWYGAPYYYGGYYPDSYYYDDSYDYDDGGDAVVYADDGDAVARCASRYRSFDASTGTYLNNDGNRYICPYLR
jgi:hypothetical protein